MIGGSCTTGTSAALAAAMLTLTACAASTYAGIDLRPGGADPDLQGLARRAGAGHKYAQLELAIRYEEGRGVLVDLERAKQLYRAAAAATGGVSYVYSPPAAKNQMGSLIRLDNGPVRPGLTEAAGRLARLRETPVAVTSTSNKKTRREGDQ